MSSQMIVSILFYYTLYMKENGQKEAECKDVRKLLKFTVFALHV